MATLPEITVEDPEETSVEALSYHIKGRSALANGYPSFSSSSAMIFGLRSRVQDAMPSSGETSQQGLYNALGLHLQDHFQMMRSGAEERESTLDDTDVFPGSEDIYESDASLTSHSNLAAGACVVGGLWTPAHKMSTDSSDTAESAEPKAAAPLFKYTGPYVHATPSPIELRAPSSLPPPPPGLPPPPPGRLPPAVLFAPFEMASSISTPSPPYKVLYLERDSPDARRRNVLIGKGASAKVFRVSSSNGMYRVIKSVNLKKIDSISLEALKTELTVLTIIKRDQMDAMHCIKKAEPGLEFVMQIPLDIPDYIAIEGRAKQLIMYSVSFSNF